MGRKMNREDDKELVAFLAVVHNVTEQEAEEIYSHYEESARQALYTAIVVENRTN